MTITKTPDIAGEEVILGKCYDKIDPTLSDFIRRQQMFFVATAPNLGHINISPKGLDSFRILGARTVAYSDFVGSGIETVAHLKENGRIVVMFCAFEGAPKIVRLHGRGEVIEPVHADFEQLRADFPEHPGLRSFIRVHCERISDSCGFAVPIFEYQRQRTQLTEWCELKGADKLLDYQRTLNARSIDGLNGLDLGPDPIERGELE